MNFKKKIIIIPVLLLFLNAFATDYYVAKDGDDSNLGTIDSPFLTIAKAASIAVAGDTVFIGEGTYEETLRPANSGNNGQPITFTSVPGERVIISGMEALSGWTSDGGAIYKTTVTWDLGQENFVLHNSTALDLARWPNNEDGKPFTQNTVRNSGGSNADAFNSRKGNLTASNIPNIDWTGGALFFYGDSGGAGWLAWKEKITSSTSGQVNFDITKNAGVNWIYTRHAPADLGDFYLEGVKGALDFQNEWWFDSTTNELFVQLPNGSEPQDGAVQMRRRTTAIDLNSRDFIHIKDLAVFGGSINVGDFNQESNNNLLSGISSFYGSHTQGILTNFNSGKASVKVKGNNNVIDKCEISFGAASGVNLSGNFNELNNNHIHDFDYIGSYDAPLVVRGIYDTKVTNNTIFNGGRDCISYFGERNEFAFNDISRSNLISDDCGLFYTTGRQESTEIHHNWFHDTYSSGDKFKAAGIYLDNDGASFSVHHNVIWNTEWNNIQINWNGTDIDIFNNTLWNGQNVMGAWHKEGTAFSNVKVWNNLGSNDQWEPQSDKQNNLVVDATVFVDVPNGNFNLKNGSSPIDQGREIAGITDGFIGANPDVGAYENGGDNWIPGIDWNPAKGPAEIGCFDLPGEDCDIVPENDQDNDGVGDEFDLCPDTPAGTTVDAVGCPVFTLAADNFTVLTSGETCASSNNGSVSITSKETSYTFIAKIEGTSTENTFTDNTVLDNLSAGDYTICITTTADADYKQCFNVTITQPEDLSVFSKVNNSKKTVSLSLDGGELYRINLNGVITLTDRSEVTLQLSEGSNSLSVTTDKDCQGQHKQDILIFDQVTVFPTLVDNQFTIAFPNGKDKLVNYQVISSTGQIIIQKNNTRVTQKLNVNVEGLTSGIYFINVVASNINFKTKIIKK